MKKTLLSIFCAMSLSVPAMADQVAVTFVDNDHYTGDAPKIMFEAQESPKMLKVSNAELGDICTINMTDATKTGIQSSDNPYLLIGKNNPFSIEPATGVTITAINFNAPSKNYNVTTFNASTGTMTATSDKDWDWAGSASEPINFTIGASKNGPQRFMYIVITYTKAGDSGVANIAVDDNAPVKYYNLQGIEVVNPQAGSTVICKQGASVKKMIVR